MSLHKSKTVPPFVCPKCARWTRSENTFYSHLVNEHKWTKEAADKFIADAPRS